MKVLLLIKNYSLKNITMYEYCINSEILFSTYDLRRHIRIMKARMNHHKSIGGKVGYFKNQIKILEEKLLKIQ